MSYKDLDVESKMAKTIYNLRRIRPFYSAVFESMKRVVDESVVTMGVSVDTFLYSENYVQNIEFEDLMFSCLHEIAHVALMHVSRRKERDPQLWNIAADLYVNKLLSEEFSITPDKPDLNNLVHFPKGVLFCSSLDLDKDYVENIYEDLNKQADANGYNSAKLSGCDGDGDNKYHFTYEGSNDNSYSLDKFSEFQIDIGLDYNGDILESSGDQVAKENNNKRVLSEAQVRYNMNKDVGTGTGLLEFQVNELLKSHIDWRKLLKKYCRKATSSDSTFSNPDKRMYYQKAIYPGNSFSDDLELKGVKICFDSSGSISDEDIAYFKGQVRDLLKEFKLQAELLYWDTDVESSGDFKTLNEMQNVKMVGRGGTNPDCLFEYFDSKKCKVKPIITLIFTDGFINTNPKNKWKRKYKDTIWVMTRDYDKHFKPAFGQLTIARFSD